MEGALAAGRGVRVPALTGRRPRSAGMDVPGAPPGQVRAAAGVVVPEVDPVTGAARQRGADIGEEQPGPQVMALLVRVEPVGGEQVRAEVPEVPVGQRAHRHPHHAGAGGADRGMGPVDGGAATGQDRPQCGRDPGDDRQVTDAQGGDGGHGGEPVEQGTQVSGVLARRGPVEGVVGADGQHEHVGPVHHGVGVLVAEHVPDPGSSPGQADQLHVPRQAVGQPGDPDQRPVAQPGPGHRAVTQDHHPHRVAVRRAVPARGVEVLELGEGRVGSPFRLCPQAPRRGEGQAWHPERHSPLHRGPR